MEEESCRRLAEQEASSASRMEEERKLKFEADKRVEQSEREEEELLRRVEEIRRKKESQIKSARDRVEQAEEEEREKLDKLREENEVIKGLVKGQVDPTTNIRTPIVSNDASHNKHNVDTLTATLVGDEVVDSMRTGAASAASNTSLGGNDSSASFRMAYKTVADGPSRRAGVKPAPLTLSEVGQSPTFPGNASVAEEKPDFKLFMDQMAGMLKMQNDMMKDMSASHLKLQKEMGELLKTTSQLHSPTVTPPTTPRTPACSPSDISTLIAHSHMPDTRPPADERWKGGRNVKTFLKKFKAQVEDLPGVTADMVWNELSFRTSGIALKLLDPYRDDPPDVAVAKAKARYLRIWARTPRDVREILEEVVKGPQVKAQDFNALIGLIAELEDYKRQAAINGDDGKFNEAEVLMAIVAARLTSLEDKWSRFTLKRRNKGDIVDFNALIGFIEDEAAALEEPEGAKARARAHDFVAQICGRSSTKKPTEKDKWGNRGGKFEPLVINAASLQDANTVEAHSQNHVFQFPQVPPRSEPSSASFARPPAASLTAAGLPPNNAQNMVWGRERKGGVCAACKQGHAFYACSQYKQLDAAARRPFAAKF